MELEALERLARNPYYKMTGKQLDTLRRLRAAQDVQHSTSFSTHPTSFETHPTEPPKQDSDGAIRG